MKSLMKIYIHYIVMVLALVLAFVVLQIVLMGVVVSKLYGNGAYRDASIQQVYESLETEEQKPTLLENMGASFAMVLDDEGVPVWNWNLPQSLNHDYTSSQIASFTRWYLEDYPVMVWGGEKGLLVVGYPRGSVWNYNVRQNMKDMNGLITFLFLSAAATTAGAIIILLISGYRYYRKMRVMADAVGQLASGGSVHLSESGTMGDIAVTLNRTSDRLAGQREKLEQRDEARSEWIRGVSHDIRTPLSLVVGYADMIEQNEGSDEQVRSRASAIRSQSLRIRDLIEDLNLTSRLEYQMQPLRLKTVSLSALLRRVAAQQINSMEAPEKYPFVITIEPEFEPCTMEADEQLLSRAFQNILGNSVRHNENGCDITVRAWMENGCPRISFRDSGSGLPPEICRYLNTGQLPEGQFHLMGIKLVKQIVEAHGGFLYVGADERTVVVNL